MPATAPDVLVGRMIREYRTKRGMSLRDLATKTRCSVGYLSELENAKRRAPNADIIECIAKAIEADSRELIADALDDRLGILLDELEITFALKWEDLGLSHDLLWELLRRDSDELKALLHTFKILLAGLGVTQEEILSAWASAYRQVERVRDRPVRRSARGRAQPGKVVRNLDREAVRMRLSWIWDWSERVTREHLAQHLFNAGWRITEDEIPDFNRTREVTYGFGRYARQRLLSLRSACHKTIVIEKRSSESQKTYLLARQVAHEALEHEEVPQLFPSTTSRTLAEIRATQEASEFAACLLLPAHPYREGLKKLMGSPSAEAALDQLEDILGYPWSLSADILFYRLALILQSEYTLSCHLLVIEQVEMPKLPDGTRVAHGPYIYRAGQHMLPVRGFITKLNSYEHHCRRWQTMKLLRGNDEHTRVTPCGAIRIQCSRFTESPNELLNFSIRPTQDTGNRHAITLCITLDEVSRKQFAFLGATSGSDGRSSPVPGLDIEEVGESCETCPLYGNCDKRVDYVYRVPGRSARLKAADRALKWINEPPGTAK